MSIEDFQVGVDTVSSIYRFEGCTRFEVNSGVMLIVLLVLCLAANREG